MCEVWSTRAIYHYLRDKNLVVAFIQETHGTSKCENVWRSEWGQKMWFSQGKSNARGVAILCTKYGASMEKVYQDQEGRVLMCKLAVENKTYLLCNVYAPNQDSPKFFQNLFKKVGQVEADHVVIGGDFNLTINP